jgi:hypothetical protein
MKKYFNIKLVIVTLSIGILVGCEDYLEELPISEVLLTEISEGNIDAALAGIYHPLTKSRGRLWESSAGNNLQLMHESIFGRSGGNVLASLGNIEGRSGSYRNGWASIYSAVGRANNLLASLEGSNLAQSTIDRAIGEAKFVRAFCYFTIVRIWGQAPLRLLPLQDPGAAGQAVAPLNAIYDQIVADLLSAEGLLDPQVANGRYGAATSGAAKVMLADVYLQLGEHTLAAGKAKEVIDNKGTYGYDLLPVFADAFSGSSDTSVEEVFYLKWSHQIGLGSFQETKWAPLHRGGATAKENGIAPRGLETGGINSGTPLIVAWSDLDQRKSYTMYQELLVDGVLTNVVGSTNYDYMFGKFRDPGAFEETAGGVDWPAYRYADALLIFAEAENISKGGPTAACYDAVNEIRRRAFNGDSSQDFPAGLSQQDFDDLVFQERGWEFLGEGKRWFDLKRTDRIQSVFVPAIQAVLPDYVLDPQYMEFVPLPNTEINTNTEID